MIFTFASQRQLSFLISAGGRNLMVAFGSRNQAGVAVFMTQDARVAQAIRRHSLSRRGIIEETTRPEELQRQQQPAGEPAGVVAETAAEKTAGKTDVDATGTMAVGTAGTTDVKPTETAAVRGDGKPVVRVYDNYTVARESICKEFGIAKNLVRKPETLTKLALEHGITIKYKEI